MSTDTEKKPLILFEDQGEAAVLRYDLPGSTSYAGSHYIDLKIDEASFDDKYKSSHTMEEIIEEIVEKIEEEKDPQEINKYLDSVFGPTLVKNLQKLNSFELAQRLNVSDKALGATKPTVGGALGVGGGATSRASPPGSIGGLPTPGRGIPTPGGDGRQDVRGSVSEVLRRGRLPFSSNNQSGGTHVDTMSPPKNNPRLLIKENYTLSSFASDFGAGRTINTTSLLPGEKTVISLKTWKKSVVTSKQASSVLDSNTSDTENELQDSINSESTHKEEQKESSSWNVQAKADVSWGFGSAEVSGGASGSSNSAREDFKKDVHNAMSKNVSKASSKRDVSVTSSLESQVETGEEQTFQRTLENTNMSRVLNFVIRQLNQEFLSILHLIDVQLVVVEPADGTSSFLPQPHLYNLSELETLLKKYFKPDQVDKLREAVIRELCTVFDFNGKVQSFIEVVNYEKGTTEKATDYIAFPANKRRNYYLRVRKDKFHPKPGSSSISLQDRILDNLQGIAVSINKYVLRTDSVIIDALLGQGAALDQYALNSQVEALRAKIVANDTGQAEIEKMNLAKSIVESGDEARAALFNKVYPTAQAKV